MALLTVRLMQFMTAPVGADQYDFFGAPDDGLQGDLGGLEGGLEVSCLSPPV